MVVSSWAEPRKGGSYGCSYASGDALKPREREGKFSAGCPDEEGGAFEGERWKAEDLCEDAG
jgi:hypothetical protein